MGSLRAYLRLSGMLLASVGLICGALHRSGTALGCSGRSLGQQSESFLKGLATEAVAFKLATCHSQKQFGRE